MQQIHDLRRIDLNLLVVLDALLSERHVSRAAQRLAMSQPAVSHALGRLRELFGDPLLVRVKSRMQLTSLALELAPKLQASLDQVRGVIGGPTFEPVRSRRHFRLGMSDYGAWVVLPALLAGTDLVLTIAERTLERLRLPEELALCEPPLAIPRFDYVQIWRGDAEREAAGAWLREQIQAAARKI